MDPSLSADAESGEMDALSQVTSRLSLVGAQKTLDSLSGPPLDRLFSILRTDENCKNLLNISMVSKSFRRDVIEFMRRPKNRPGLCRVELNERDDGLCVEMELFPSNIPFHDLSGLDWGRFKRGTSRYWNDKSTPKLIVNIRGQEDPIMEQVRDLLATTLTKVDIGTGFGSLFDPGDLSLIAQFLRASTIDNLRFLMNTIDDTDAPHIISIVSHAKKIEIAIVVMPAEFSDPEAFITQLDAMPFSCVSLSDYSSSFFGLTPSFWQSFINNKLRNHYVTLQTIYDITVTCETPFVMPDTPIVGLTWKKIDAN